MISRIKIENYKSIRNLDFEMKPINILIGANGVGKSNFINFFNFLKQIHDQKLQLHVAEEGNATVYCLSNSSRVPNAGEDIYLFY